MPDNDRGLLFRALNNGWLLPSEGERIIAFSWDDVDSNGKPKWVAIAKGYRAGRLGTRWKVVFKPYRDFYLKKRRKKARRKPLGRYLASNSSPRLRQRPLPGHELGKDLVGAKIGTYRRYENGVLAETQNQNQLASTGISLHWEQTLDALHPGPPYRQGGPFKSIKYHYDQARRQGKGVYTSQGNPNLPQGRLWTYTGEFACSSDWGSANGHNLTTATISGLPSLLDYHTAAWDRTKPQVPKVSLSQFLVELRDLPRMLANTANTLHNSWRSFGGGYSSVVMHPKSVANDFVNHEFGWVPFLSDLSKLWDLWSRSHEYIQDTVKNNGRWLRRRRVLEASELSERTNRFYNSGTSPTDGNLNTRGLVAPMIVDGITCRGLTDIVRTTISTVWAVGSFKYYRPEFDDSLEDFTSQWANVRRLFSLYGLRINPSVLWKVTPWSWLVDWFSSVGDFIDKHTDFVEDGIVSRYLYVMRRSEIRYTKTCLINFYSGPLSMSWTRNQVTKQREVADSPYGFNKPWNTLSPRQIAILGAIGTSRSNLGFISRG